MVSFRLRWIGEALHKMLHSAVSAQGLAVACITHLEHTVTFKQASGKLFLNITATDLTTGQMSFNTRCKITSGRSLGDQCVKHDPLFIHVFKVTVAGLFIK